MDARRRTALIIWAASVMSVLLFMGIALTLEVGITFSQSPLQAFLLAAWSLSVTTLALSLVVPARLPHTGSAQARALTQTIVGTALCEVGCLLSAVFLLMTNDRSFLGRSFLGPFAVSFVGMLLQYPSAARWPKSGETANAFVR